MAHRVFVSHATEDLDTASRVCKVLEAQGVSCWLASRDVKAGTDYAEGILDAIKTAELVVLVFSKYANDSPYVLREVERAVAYKRPVLALRVDEATPSASMEYYLNLWQWLDTSAGIEKNRAEIAAAVRNQLERAPSPMRDGEQRAQVQAAPTDGSARRLSRRRLGIAVGVVVLVAAVGVGSWVGVHHSRSRALAENTSGRVPNSWTDLAPKGEVPVARSAPSMVYDTDIKRVILFGGGDSGNIGPYVDSGTTPLTDTWAYTSSTNTWTELHPLGAPPPRMGQSMVYDPDIKRVLVFGGFAYPFNQGLWLNDTWAYTPSTNTWTELHPSGAPPPRQGQSMVYDPDIKRVLVFGGSPEAGYLNDTWAYDPQTNRWTNLKPSGTLPFPRDGQSMVYAPDVKRVIMFGGNFNGSRSFEETWAYDPAANTWTNLHPPAPVPAAGYCQSMVYDPRTKRVVLFGGLYGGGILPNDTWAFDPLTNSWAKLSPVGKLPGERGAQAMVYDSSDGQMIMFGGQNGDTSYLNDTWGYTP